MKLIKELNEARSYMKYVKFTPDFIDKFNVSDLVKILKQKQFYEFPGDMPKFKSIQFLGFSNDFGLVFSAIDDKNVEHNFIIYRFNNKWEIE